MWCTQYDNSVAESAGLLKMDFLGLKTLTLIKDTVKIIKAMTGKVDPLIKFRWMTKLLMNFFKKEKQWAFFNMNLLDAKAFEIITTNSIFRLNCYERII